MISTRCFGWKTGSTNDTNALAMRPDMIKLANIHFHESEFTDGVLDGDHSTSLILRNPSWDFAKRWAQSAGNLGKDLDKMSGMKMDEMAGGQHMRLISFLIPCFFKSRCWTKHCDPSDIEIFEAETLNNLRLSAAPRRGSETYFQPGQYKPNLDAVRPKLELEAQVFQCCFAGKSPVEPML